MKASEALIAWNNARDAYRKSPPGSIAVGPVVDSLDWPRLYSSTGGAAYAARRKLFGASQQLAVLQDFYGLVYVYGLHPYVVHRAFLLIDEFQAVIKRGGYGPAKGEPGHDPDIPYGRCIDTVLPEVRVWRTGAATHFWPAVADHV